MTFSRRQWETFALIGLLCMAAILRIYRLPENLHWRGDEGRDALIMREMIMTHHPVLIGPPASIVTTAGSINLGPLTYYLMTVGLWFAGGDPIGPAVIVAIFSVATVWLLWLVGRSWFSPMVGWITAGLFAVQNNAILFGRHAWNPNFMPGFAVLTMWSIWKAWGRGNSWWWVIASASLMAAVQAHATGWALAPVAIAAWIFSAMKKRRGSKAEQRTFWLSTLVAIGAGALITAPLIAYDAAHHWHNLRVIQAYVTATSTSGGTMTAEVVRQFFEQLRLAVQDILVGNQVRIAWVTVIIFSIGDVLFFLKAPRQEKKSIGLLGAWIISSGVFLALLRGPIFIQYRELLWPAVTLLTGWFIWRLVQLSKNYVVAIIVSIGIIILFIGSVTARLSRENPDYDFQSSKIAENIIKTDAADQPYGLSMLSPRGNNDSAYRYILEWKYRPPVAMVNTHQAYVICEDTECSQQAVGTLESITWANGQYRTSWRLSPNVTMVKLIR